MAAIALTVVGLRLATPAEGSVHRSAAGPAPAALAKPNRIPFTRVDVLLLVTGGAMLLLLGSAVGRARDGRTSAVEVDGDA